MKTKQIRMKTPTELQLQKLNLNNIYQQKSLELNYHLLRMLNEIVVNNVEIVSTPIFIKIYNQFLNLDGFETIKNIPLFQTFTYRIWNNQIFPIEIRQKTSFYRIVSNWIISFELRTGKLDNIRSQFELIKQFMQKETNTSLERIVMIEEIFEDLKDLLDKQFWVEENIINDQGYKDFKNQKKAQINNVEEVDNRDNDQAQIEIIVAVLEMIIGPQICRFDKKNQLFQACTYNNLNFKNYYEFIKKCLYYIFRMNKIPNHQQTEVTKIALIYLQSFKTEKTSQIINLLKHLMLKTCKPVRFALILEYVEFYEYLELVGFENVIQQLESMVYFRELIIGKKVIEENIVQLGNNMNELNLSFQEEFIKAGLSKKIYFSNESTKDCVLKLDILVRQNDVNLKIIHLNSIPFIKRQKDTSLNRFIFDTLEVANHFDASKGENLKESVYWRQDRSTSKKLQLRLQYKGLYGLQFDNSYSWLAGKNIKYRLELFESVD